MPLKALYPSKFKKQFKALNKEVQESISKLIDAFLAGEKVDVLRLTGKKWRLKMGDWRVFFDFEGEVITLTSVGRRTTTTYKKR
ncbi:MAG: type II toxin-antitoxin system RelE/ParE family toxin [Candidatus Riflebacteria bacterium]|nr:type II toxin-antitoxin system RelE/ParE family toxin [Candidatus Riflebacteria bacterium]